MIAFFLINCLPFFFNRMLMALFSYFLLLSFLCVVHMSFYVSNCGKFNCVCLYMPSFLCLCVNYLCVFILIEKMCNMLYALNMLNFMKDFLPITHLSINLPCFQHMTWSLGCIFAHVHHSIIFFFLKYRILLHFDLDFYIYVTST